MERRTCNIILSSIGLLLDGMLQLRRGHHAFATFGPSFGAKMAMMQTAAAGMAGRAGLMVTEAHLSEPKYRVLCDLYMALVPRTSLPLQSQRRPFNGGIISYASRGIFSNLRASGL